MAYTSPSTGQRIEAVLLDTFGTVVDWRTGVAREVAAFAERQRIVDLDAWAFADAWRARYQPSMEPIRAGTREFVPLDQLHRESLATVLPEFGLDPSDHADELDDLATAWERLDPWDDSVTGLAALRGQVIVGPLSNANLALLLRMALRALAAAQRAGLGTAFIPRPTELGPGQREDLTADGDWDLVCVSIVELAHRFGPQPTGEHLTGTPAR